MTKRNPAPDLIRGLYRSRWRPRIKSGAGWFLALAAIQVVTVAPVQASVWETFQDVCVSPISAGGDFVRPTLNPAPKQDDVKVIDEKDFTGEAAAYWIDDKTILVLDPAPKAALIRSCEVFSRTSLPEAAAIDWMLGDVAPKGFEWSASGQEGWAWKMLAFGTYLTVTVSVASHGGGYAYGAYETREPF